MNDNAKGDNVMLKEQLCGGGWLVRLASGSLAVEGVPSAKRHQVVESALSCADGARHRRGVYRLTRRVVAHTDLWHVKRMPAKFE